ncbi:MAG TPA: hypothetical protein VGI82_04350 [Chitinophagaceae bacterium]
MNSGNVVTVIDKEGLLNYTFTTAYGDTLIKSKEHPSVYQGWLIYWDSLTQKLWVQSSDIGIYVWQKNENQEIYGENAIGPNQTMLIEAIPQEFFNSFPEADKEFCRKYGYDSAK